MKFTGINSTIHVLSKVQVKLFATKSILFVLAYCIHRGMIFSI